MYELRPSPSEEKLQGGIFGKGRILMGRSESCDFIVNHVAVSTIHAVLEIFEDHAVLYDMNSTNGTYVNDEKIIKKEIHLGDKFSLGICEFEFCALDASDDSVSKSLPKNAPQVSDFLPSVIYPLSLDPKAEFSEYIFEDKDELYPIFKYEASKRAVEVIVLYKEKVFNFDFLPESRMTYYICGSCTERNELEFPYFKPNEKFPLVDVYSEGSSVHSLPGFTVFHLSDGRKDNGYQSVTVDLRGNDLVRLTKDDIQIFIRNVLAPPAVLPAPILKRDKVFQKYLMTSLGALIIFCIGINKISVDKNLNKSKKEAEYLVRILGR